MSAEPEADPLVHTPEPRNLKLSPLVIDYCYSLKPSQVSLFKPRRLSDSSAIFKSILCLILGLVFAVGHHVYNPYLHGKQVQQVALSQNVDIGVGTTFTFRVKAALTGAVTVAYIQSLWTKLRAKAFEIRHVDTLMKAPMDPHVILDIKPWTLAPILVLLYLAICYQAHLRNQDAQHASVLIQRNAMGEPRPRRCGRGVFLGASGSVQRVGFIAATIGAIIAAPYAYLNKSYRLNLDGPAVKCSIANVTSISTSAISIGDVSYWVWIGSDDHRILATPTDNWDNQNLGVGNIWSSWSPEDSAVWLLIPVDTYDPEHNLNDTDIASYQALMDAYAKLIVEYATSQFGGTRPEATLESTERDKGTLFQNMILSIWSMPYLLTDPNEIPQIPANITTYPLTYQYERRDLWLTYGAAISVNFVTMPVGIVAVFVSGASYAPKFSTGLRMARDSGLHDVLDEDDH
ncbi:hypothetical protein GGR57DRAFT_511595 [Xylariaceae sp. FL1272]|nr:hypothetical protein GGR57DRAFT_511595 [Xylariaceae sp. FL1272]